VLPALKVDITGQRWTRSTSALRSYPRLARETASASQPKAQVKAFRDHLDTSDETNDDDDVLYPLRPSPRSGNSPSTFHEPALAAL
jgi:hypothetical protein